MTIKVEYTEADRVRYAESLGFAIHPRCAHCGADLTRLGDDRYIVQAENHWTHIEMEESNV